MNKACHKYPSSTTFLSGKKGIKIHLVVAPVNQHHRLLYYYYYLLGPTCRCVLPGSVQLLVGSQLYSVGSTSHMQWRMHC